MLPLKKSIDMGLTQLDIKTYYEVILHNNTTSSHAIRKTHCQQLSVFKTLFSQV